MGDMDIGECPDHHTLDYNVGADGGQRLEHGNHVDGVPCKLGIWLRELGEIIEGTKSGRLIDRR